jgi:A/G-specific adenine glycosylase
MAKKTVKIDPEISSAKGKNYDSSTAKSSFTQNLLQWNDEQNTRQMPWKGEPDPYKIWLSEIILQQTRVEQGWAYYLKFIDRFPTLAELAQAPDDEVFKLWEGLGYYSRCRNLLAAARTVVEKFNAVFPKDYNAILALKGVGPYTAAAIASFGFGLPYAVVDGNVIRVLARFFGIHTAFDTTSGKKFFEALAQDLLEKDKAGIYNQAIMDFGAVICKPASPLCAQCPLHKNCYAFRHEETSVLPVKAKSITKKERWFTCFVITGPKGKLVRQRNHKDVWQHLYEFVMVESPETIEWSFQDCKKWISQKTSIKVESLTKTDKLTQQLTHQTVHVQFQNATTSFQDDVPGYEWVNEQELARLAFPRIIRKYLDAPMPSQGRLL